MREESGVLTFTDSAVFLKVDGLTDNPLLGCQAHTEIRVSA
jgi:hypothetical protein